MTVDNSDRWTLFTPRTVDGLTDGRIDDGSQHISCRQSGPAGSGVLPGIVHIPSVSILICSGRQRYIKDKGLDTCYSTTYMSQTRDHQRFTISEVAAGWHDPLVLQRIMRPSIGRGDGHWTQLADTPSSQARPSPSSLRLVSYYSISSR